MTGSSKRKVSVWWEEKPESYTKTIAERVEEFCKEGAIDLKIECNPAAGTGSYRNAFENNMPSDIKKILKEYIAIRENDEEFAAWAGRDDIKKKLEPLFDYKEALAEGRAKILIEGKLREDDSEIVLLLKVCNYGNKPVIEIICSNDLKGRVDSAIKKLESSEESELAKIQFSQSGIIEYPRLVVCQLWLPDDGFCEMPSINNSVLAMMRHLNEKGLFELTVGAFEEECSESAIGILSMLSAVPSISVLGTHEEMEKDLRATRFEFLKLNLDEVDRRSDKYKEYGETYAKTLCEFIGKLF